MTDPGPAPGADRAFVDALPKVELHVHLEGSMRPETLLDLRERHQIDDLPATRAAIRQWYEFRDFDHFITVYLASVRALKDGADFAALARATADGLAAQNVPYAEVTFTPWLHMSRGIALREVFAGLEEGRVAAERRSGVELRWITDVPGDMGVEAAERTLEALLDLGGAALGPQGGSVVGFGLGGPEVARPPFRAVFAAARAAGLHSVPHAGEAAGPESVWAALDELGAKRIGHGISAVEDTALLARLRAERTVLEVCPTSNVRTGVVPDLAAHPLAALVGAGLAVTVNSDDPPMFDTTLTGEYLAALGPLGLSRTQLVACAATAIGGSFMPSAQKEALQAELAQAAQSI